MPEFRPGTVDDAASIARLHADSWRRHYRGAYADSYLDGDLEAERRAVWASRLASPAGTATILAERDGRPAGFVHVVFDHDPRWGSLIDNLHVAHHFQRTGIGRHLLGLGAGLADGPMYLWVLEQNTAAQRFYLTCGGTPADSAVVSGAPERLHGTPRKLRMVWAEVTGYRT